MQPGSTFFAFDQCCSLMAKGKKCVIFIPRALFRIFPFKNTSSVMGIRSEVIESIVLSVFLRSTLIPNPSTTLSEWSNETPVTLQRKSPRVSSSKNVIRFVVGDSLARVFLAFSLRSVACLLKSTALKGTLVGEADVEILGMSTITAFFGGDVGTDRLIFAFDIGLFETKSSCIAREQICCSTSEVFLAAIQFFSEGHTLLLKGW
mmetsp:Transcript_31442/g.45847  ORF Transcript_31442/g.45847 Transcript_31442/m.45847 type:complete len:205 (+) Transcript_31442:1426-2040(+)